MLQEVVRQQFDPDKFTGVFNKGGSGPPKWLDGIITHRCSLRLYWILPAWMAVRLFMS